MSVTPTPHVAPPATAMTQPTSLTPPILVTGALGSLGEHVLDALHTTGSRVVLSDLPSRDNRRRARALLQRLGPRFEVQWADLRDGEAVEKLVQATKPSAVIHLAAVLPPLSEAPGTPTEAVNRDGTRNLIQALTQRAPSARVVLASSYAVYGPRHPGAPGPDGRPAPALLRADSPTNPVDRYGRSKLAAEKIVAASGLPFVVLRLGAVVPFDNRLDSLLTMRMLFEIPWDGLRHAVDPRDAGLAFARAASVPAAVGRTLLIAGDSSFRTQHGPSMARQLEQRGLPALDYEVFCPPRAAADAYFTEGYMDTSEAQALLGFQQHTHADYEAEARRRAPRGSALMPLVAGPARLFLRGLSPYRAGAEAPRTPLHQRVAALHRPHGELANVHAEHWSPLPPHALRHQLNEPGWDEWSVFLKTLHIRQAPGESAPMGRGTLRLRAPGGHGVPVPVAVLETSERELRWRGGIPGVFEGEHYLRFEGDGEGTRISHGERFTGVLGERVATAIRPFVDALYEREAASLAGRSQSGAPRPPVALPRTALGLDAAWLERVLAEQHPDVRVAEVQLESESHAGDGLASTADRLSLRVRYESNPGDVLPERMLLKTIFLGGALRVGPGTIRGLAAASDALSRVPGGVALRHRAFHGLTRFQERFPQAPDAMYANEVRFYRDVRTSLAIETPAAYASVRNNETRSFFVLMEDLAARGAHFPNATEALSVAAMKGLLETLAALHASHWLSPALEGPLRWVPTSTSGGMAQVFAGLGLELIRAQLALYPEKAALIAPLGRSLDELWAAMWQVQARMAETPQTLLHGDVHIGNTYLLPSGPGGLLDWQLMMRGCWAHDVAYVIATGLDTETRRANEHALLAHYREHLLAHEVHLAPSASEAFELYRRAISWGLVIGWLITPPQNYGDRITHANIARLVAAAHDLDTFVGLG